MNGKIYKITNIITGDSYIGQTVQSVEKRFNQHKAGLQFNNKLSKLQLAMKKYGIDNFRITTIESNIDDIDELALREKFYIKKYNTIEQYNSSTGGESPLRHTQSGFILTTDFFSRINFYELKRIERAEFWGIVSLLPRYDGEIDMKLEEFASIINSPSNHYSLKQIRIGLISLIDKLNINQDFFLASEINEEYFSLVISPMILDSFENDNKGYITVNLSTLVNFKNKYSTDLYLLLSRWKRMRKYKYPGLLKQRLLVVKNQLHSNYSTYTDFRRKVLAPAIEELTTMDNHGFAPLEMNYIKLIDGLRKKDRIIEISFKMNMLPNKFYKSIDSSPATVIYSDVLSPEIINSEQKNMKIEDSILCFVWNKVKHRTSDNLKISIDTIKNNIDYESFNANDQFTLRNTKLAIQKMMSSAHQYITTDKEVMIVTLFKSCALKPDCIELKVSPYFDKYNEDVLKTILA